MNQIIDRRHWLQSFGMGLGSIAASQLLHRDAASAAPANSPSDGIPSHGVINPTHRAPKAKRVIYLFQAGGPSQLETWDYKPLLNEKQGEPLPDSVRQGQRLTGMSGNQAILPLAGSIFKFNQHGKNGAWVSELMPHMAKRVDDIAIVKSMFTEAINHDP
ncbi:MAG: DUF1501 domain-containing protein, partial [Planctomycetales bacterium]|nr:DUF1501 domain-containing protein [Planctomycetales bacterium]